MPRIDDTSILKKKSFKKKSYRPWNLLDDNLLTTKNEVIYINNTNIETGHKPDTNRTQIEHKPDTNRAQTGHKQNQAFIETEHKPDTQPDTKSNLNRTQTGHKPDTKYQYPSLVGLQRKLLIFLIEDCKNTRSRITQEMSLEHIAENLKVPIGGLKTTLRRLEKKSFIRIIEFKNGRGGWRKYEIPDDVYKELLRLHLEHKPSTNRTQTEHKPDTKPSTQPDTTLSSSSSININKTTTDEPENISNEPALFKEWETINMEPVAEIGFSKYHLTQIASQNKLTPVMVQESIHAFAFDLRENNKAKSLKTSPLNYFMGILRNGNPYAPPTNYESEDSRAMRIYLEKKQEIEKKRIELEEKLFDVEFGDWRNNLTNDQIDELLPADVKNQNLAAPKTVFLRSYFKNEVWPEKRQEIMKGGSGG